MTIESLIYMLEYVKDYSDKPVRYIERISDDAIKVELDDYTVLRVEWANGTDIIVIMLAPDRIQYQYIEGGKEADDDKR